MRSIKDIKKILLADQKRTARSKIFKTYQDLRNDIAKLNQSLANEQFGAKYQDYLAADVTSQERSKNESIGLNSSGQESLSIYAVVIHTDIKSATSGDDSYVWADVPPFSDAAVQVNHPDDFEPNQDTDWTQYESIKFYWTNTITNSTPKHKSIVSVKVPRSFLNHTNKEPYRARVEEVIIAEPGLPANTNANGVTNPGSAAGGQQAGVRTRKQTNLPQGYSNAIATEVEYNNGDKVTLIKFSFVNSTEKEATDAYTKILAGIGAQATQNNLAFLRAWRTAESGDATFNPFNTTWKYQDNGSTWNNYVGVQNYVSMEQGIDATIKTLKQSQYKNIVAAFQAGNKTPQEIAEIPDFDTWGTERGLLRQTVVNPNNKGLIPKLPPGVNVPKSAPPETRRGAAKPEEKKEDSQKKPAVADNTAPPKPPNTSKSAPTSNPKLLLVNIETDLSRSTSNNSKLGATSIKIREDIAPSIKFIKQILNYYEVPLTCESINVDINNKFISKLARVGLELRLNPNAGLNEKSNLEYDDFYIAPDPLNPHSNKLKVYGHVRRNVPFFGGFSSFTKPLDVYDVTETYLKKKPKLVKIYKTLIDITQIFESFGFLTLMPEKNFLFLSDYKKSNWNIFYSTSKINVGYSYKELLYSVYEKNGEQIWFERDTFWDGEKFVWQ